MYFYYFLFIIFFINLPNFLTSVVGWKKVWDTTHVKISRIHHRPFYRFFFEGRSARGLSTWQTVNGVCRTHRWPKTRRQKFLFDFNFSSLRKGSLGSSASSATLACLFCTENRRWKKVFSCTRLLYCFVCCWRLRFNVVAKRVASNLFVGAALLAAGLLKYIFFGEGLLREFVIEHKKLYDGGGVTLLFLFLLQICRLFVC